MNIIHILGITILFSYSLTEKTNSKQRILLRKLLSEPKDSKPMWNEVLADVLVNKIRMFSFKNPNTETESITELNQEKSALTNFISQLFFIYKKLVYDVFVGAPEPNNSIDPFTPEIEERSDPDDVFKEHAVTFSDGPKGEVELLEPRYHGKQVLRNETEGNISEESSESEKICPEGSVKVDGACVSKSKLIMMIPSQCPIGYRRDRLGYCRMRF